jgi:hypothetical protein
MHPELFQPPELRLDNTGQIRTRVALNAIGMVLGGPRKPPFFIIMLHLMAGDAKRYVMLKQPPPVMVIGTPTIVTRAMITTQRFDALFIYPQLIYLKHLEL